jgi:hypothetical protein
LNTAPVAKALSVASLVVAAMAALEVRGPLPAAVTLAFLGLAPGLALSLHMGPMAGEARLLISAVGSAAVGTMVSLGLLYADFWSGRLGLFCVALLTQVTALAAIALDRTVAQPDDDAGEGRR